MPTSIVPESREHWLQLKAEDVSSTEVGALFGMSPYLTEMELFFIKAGKAASDFESNDRMRWGTRLERAIAEGVAEDMGLDVRKVNRYMRHSTVPRMGSSFDFEIINSERGPGIMEIKNVDGIIYKQQWEEDEAPEHIELQVQHQMEVADREWTLIVPLVGGNQAHPFIRERNRDVGKALCDRITKFWADVEAGNEPEANYLIDSEFIIKLHQRAGDQILQLDDDHIRDLFTNYKRVSAEISDSEKHKDAIKAEILDAIGDDCSKVLCDNFTLSCGMTLPVEPTLITPEMVGQTYGGRKGFRNFRLNLKTK